MSIQWVHENDDASMAAAKAMMEGYGTTELGTRAALNSRHTERKAIDMSISWKGTLSIADATGTLVEIKTEPRTGMNSELRAIGSSYGVTKYWKGAKDKPHWLTDGK